MPTRQPLDSILVNASSDLTPTERRLAQLLDNDPTIVAFATVAELAELVDTSGPTIVRFASKLGFSGYSDLQRHVRDDVSARLERPTDRIKASVDIDFAAATRRAAHAAIDMAFERCTPADLEAMTTAIARATGHVWIVASETSSPVAHLLASNLALIRPRVHHVTGSDAAVSTTLIDASANDVVIAIDAARYEQSVIDTSTLLANEGATVVAITDGPLSPLCTIADHWCNVAVNAVGPFDSAITIVAIAELLIASVAARLHDEASSRLERAEAAWTSRSVFTEDTP